MKGDGELGEHVTEADDLEVLGWVVRRRKLGSNDEAKAMVVAMIAKEDAALGALLAQRLETGLDELRAHTTPLNGRVNRHRAKRKPSVWRRRCDPRKGDVPDDLLMQHRNQRQDESIGLTECIDDERLGSIAEREPGEGARRQGADRGPVSDRLATNHDGKAVP